MNKNYLKKHRIIRVGSLAAAGSLLGSTLPLNAQSFFDFEESTGGWTARASNAVLAVETQPEHATSGTGVLAITAPSGGWYEAANVTLQTDHPAYEAIVAGQGNETPMSLAFDVILDPLNDGGYRADKANPWFEVNFRIEAGAGNDFRSQFTNPAGIEQWPEALTTYTAEVPVDDIAISPGSAMTLIVIFNSNDASNFTVYLDNIRVAETGSSGPVEPEAIAEAMAYFAVESHDYEWIHLPDSLGWFHAGDFPWIYSLDHEWLYVLAQGTFPEGGWFYDINRQDWWYTTPNVDGGYPWVHTLKEGWIYLE